MALREIGFANGEIYHIYNQGVDKRLIFKDSDDLNRFVQSMIEFNTLEPIGSIYENSFVKDKFTLLGRGTSKLVSFINFCLNPNHFHFSLRQESDGGIQKFMQRLGSGYPKYFNNKYHRKGTLYQGGFKAKHINTNEYLLHLGAYINMNDRVHKIDSLGRGTSKLIGSWTSLSEYIGGEAGPAQKTFGDICDSSIILNQFSSKKEYSCFAKDSLAISLEKKEEKHDLEGWW